MLTRRSLFLAPAIIPISNLMPVHTPKYRLILHNLLGSGWDYVANFPRPASWPATSYYGTCHIFATDGKVIARARFIGVDGTHEYDISDVFACPLHATNQSDLRLASAKFRPSPTPSMVSKDA